MIVVASTAEPVIIRIMIRASGVLDGVEVPPVGADGGATGGVGTIFSATTLNPTITVPEVSPTK